MQNGDTKGTYPAHQQFHRVSEDLLSGYAELIELGYPPGIIASAMLAATVNFYKLVACSEPLTDILRNLADHIDLHDDANTYPFWDTLSRN